ncbi:hypothetical protein AgCh_032428 [Apium graveolens]
MANNPAEGYPDDFLEQILAIPAYNGLAGGDGSSSENSQLTAGGQLGSGAGVIQQPFFPLGLSLDNGQRERVSVNMGSLFPAFEHLQPQSIRHTVPQIHQAFQGQTTTSTAVTVPHPPNMRPRVRARRGQATDPHSIAERLRRERIAERMRALQDLVPSCNKNASALLPLTLLNASPNSILPSTRLSFANYKILPIASVFILWNSLKITRIKLLLFSELMLFVLLTHWIFSQTDKAAMLDEILDYVKFLRLQVKVLSMSRLGGAGAVAQLVADIPLQSVEGGITENGSNQPIWENWSNDDTEREVAKLMEEDVGAAMQFLQSKALCIMPISLAALIYPTNQPDISTLVKPEPPAPS